MLAGQYLCDVKAHCSNGNNKSSVFSCGQNFRRKWRLKVRASDISHKLSVHFSRRGTLPAGQYLYHVKAHASNGSNKGSVFFVRPKFSSEMASESGCNHVPHYGHAATCDTSTNRTSPHRPHRNFCEAGMTGKMRKTTCATSSLTSTLSFLATSVRASLPHTDTTAMSTHHYRIIISHLLLHYPCANTLPSRGIPPLDGC